MHEFIIWITSKGAIFDPHYPIFIFTLEMAISFVVANMFPFKMVSEVILLLPKIVKKTCTPWIYFYLGLKIYANFILRLSNVCLLSLRYESINIRFFISFLVNRTILWQYKCLNSNIGGMWGISNYAFYVDSCLYIEKVMA